jgi:hypothetical protein
MVKNKKNCSWPPIFDIKSRRLNVKENCCIFFHGDLGMVETNVFDFWLLLSALKVGGREQKNCLGHALSFKALCLKFYAWPKSILFNICFLLLEPKLGGRIQKNCFNHALSFQDSCLEF